MVHGRSADGTNLAYLQEPHAKERARRSWTGIGLFGEGTEMHPPTNPLQVPLLPFAHVDLVGVAISDSRKHGMLSLAPCSAA